MMIDFKAAGFDSLEEYLEACARLGVDGISTYGSMFNAWKPDDVEVTLNGEPVSFGTNPNAYYDCKITNIKMFNTHFRKKKSGRFGVKPKVVRTTDVALCVEHTPADGEPSLVEMFNELNKD